MPNSIRFGRSATSHLARTTNLPSRAACTIMGWFRINANAGTEFLWDLSDGTTEFSLLLQSGVSLKTFTTGLSPGTTLSVGRWYHIAVTGSGSAVTGYLDGVNTAGIGNTSSAFTPTALWFGARVSNTAQFCSASIAAIKIYNRALTSGEIAAEIPWALPLNWAGLNSCYPVPGGWDAIDAQVPLAKAAKTRWPDYTGNSLEWSETGTVETDPGPPIQWAPPNSLYRGRRRLIANAGAGATVVQRATLSLLGTRVGSRQVRN